jgi:diguanylate cyclase (GGDEF)-like protein/PAS domain S-box-containing protein
MGVLGLCDKFAGDFTEYDEAVLVQVAQLAAALIQKAISLHQARAAEREYRYLFDKNPNPMWVYDNRTLAFLAVNEAAIRHYGYSREEFLAMSIRQIRPAEDVPVLDVELGKIPAAAASKHENTWRHRRKGGDVIEVEVTSYPIEFAQRDGRLTLIRDVTDSMQTKVRLAERDVQLTALLDSTAEGIYGLDPLGFCTFSNAACARMLGYDSPQDLVGCAMHDVAHHTRGDGTPYPMHECAVQRAYVEAIPQHVDDELMWRRDGTAFPAEYWAYPITKSNTVVGVVVSFFDITERQAYAQALEHQATHDSLTGLPNRHTLHGTIENAVNAARTRDQGVALFLIDLDRFKEVNDTLGHHAGDQLLMQLADRLREAAEGRAALVRLGGDEFAVVIGQLDSREAAEDKARTLLRHIKAPFELTGMRVQIGASIGIAMHPQHGDDPGVLLRRADIAMYAAKRDGSGHAVYHEALDFHTPERLTLLSDAHTAIQENQLLLHFQPKMHIATRRVIGFEALVRWRHPRRGLISPGEFIPLIELSDLIRPLTLWVLENAIVECKRWHSRGQRLGVGVNISTRNLLDLALPGQVLELLARHQLDPCHLELEITESAIMADTERAMEVLRELSAAGISIAVDDFGTGYSSLGYLEKLRVRSLKIDRSFVHHMNERDGARNIVTAVIALAHNMGLSVVAEGVESKPILDALGALRCDLAQGYFIARPMPASEVTGWLANSGYLV